MRVDGASTALSIALALALAATLFLDRTPRTEAVAVVEDPSELVPETPSAAAVSNPPEPITLPPPPLVEAAAEEPVSGPARALVPTETQVEDDIEPLPRPPVARPVPPQAIEPLRPEPVRETPAEAVEPIRPAPVVPAPQTVALPAEDEETLWEGPIGPAVSEASLAAPPSEATVAEGRALLRILEHGSGPAIEIAWPSAPGDREELFRRFRACFGMRLALIDGEGRLYVREGVPGRPAEIDLDRLSGFVRQPAGAMSAAERRQIADLSAYHRAPSGLAPVRMFPRRVDAFLLGGMRHLVGEGYMEVEVLHARYRIDGASVLVEAITVDDRPVRGHIDLGRAVRTACG